MAGRKLGSKNKVQRVLDGGRVCVSCNEFKVAAEFHKHSKCLGGINTVCKSCRKPLSQEQYKRTSVPYRMWNASRHRAKLCNVPHSITVDDIVIPSHCPVLGLKLENNNHQCAPSLDRIIPSLGYVSGNICVISNRANMIKNAASEDELYAVYLYLRNHNRNCEI